MPKFKSKTHEKFVNEISDRPIIVIGRYSGSHNKIEFKCADCGNTWLAAPTNILRGKGCPPCNRRKAARKAAKKNRKCNEIVKVEDGLIYLDVSTPNLKNKTMVMSYNDYMLIRMSITQNRFFAVKSNGHNVYAVVISNGKLIKAHKLLIDSGEVDHINGDGLDNRRSNLRACTHSQNMMNKSHSKNNTSGFRGVYLQKSNNKWMAKIGYNGKLLSLGVFDLKQDAIEARKKAEKKYYGEFAHNQ